MHYHLHKHTNRIITNCPIRSNLYGTTRRTRKFEAASTSTYGRRLAGGYGSRVVYKFNVLLRIREAESECFDSTYIKLKGKRKKN
ncbi:hypothetical protein FNV43_RR09281 [Rhamnella rubrinervis]|uniref:Uncharacterized protein n=1 Tax=Rhamnella rubrinervis TaxID=2594499 RepID=A0A8K0MK27_9ROSA|nr:hypothetical protein FNV43_RR09281 [Rhamnella rubrinervis]